MEMPKIMEVTPFDVVEYGGIEFRHRPLQGWELVKILDSLQRC
jgi:hypothetical protein